MPVTDAGNPVRLALVFGFAAVVAVSAVAWGWSVGADPAPARLGDQTTPAGADWYAALPLDANAATDAYLARIPADVRARGEAYSDTRLLAFDLRVLTLIAATLVICATGFSARLRDLAVRLPAPRALVDAAVAVPYFVALYAFSLPADVYATFVRPHRAGFSDQSFAGWLGDSLVNWGVFTLFYLVAVVVIYGCMRRRPKQWVAFAIGVYAVLRVLYALLSPNVIEPLTNDFRPLPEGAQKQQILALARENGVDEVAVVTGDASRQTRLLNAHVSGFAGTARISVDDTTLRKTSDPMLRFVVAHEIGHFVLDHDAASMLTDTLVMGIGFILIAFCTRVLVRRFGSAWGMSGVGDIATLPIFWGLFLLWGFVSLPATNAISRVYEHQADLFGLNASQSPHGLAEFMIHDADVSRLNPSAVEYSLFYSHPSDAERVATAMKWRSAHARLSPP